MNPQCQNTFEIWLGDDKQLPLKAVYQNGGDPLDLTNCTEILVPLPNSDGSVTTLTLSNSGGVTIVQPPVLGKILVGISAIESLLLNVGELQNLDVTYTISAKPMTVRFAQAISVFER